ncbi:FG-GAP-like repeat-containing protein [Tautonia marina]|uniref:FG-GAP-like repeat-containing protein n=1 Tax=Tautonia marina TaxID=2653855 RepID=UPI0012607FB8|nr:FG-GAP-like repeat-containing protein [Tautonia marina]
MSTIRRRNRATRLEVCALEARRLMSVDLDGVHALFHAHLNYGRQVGMSHWGPLGVKPEAMVGWEPRPPLTPEAGARAANVEWASRIDELQRLGHAGLHHIDPITGTTPTDRHEGHVIAGTGMAENVYGGNLPGSLNLTPRGPIEALGPWVASPGHFNNLNTIWDGWDSQMLKNIDRYGVGSNWEGTPEDRLSGSFVSFSTYGSVFPSPPFATRALTGVVFDDQNGNGWLDLGEGRSVTIRATALDTGAVVETTSTSGGLYQLSLATDASYRVEVTVQGITSPMVADVSMSQWNRTANVVIGRGVFFDYAEVIVPTIPRTGPSAFPEAVNVVAGSPIVVELTDSALPGQGAGVFVVDAMTTEGTPVTTTDSGITLTPVVGTTTVIYVIANEAGLLDASTVTITATSPPPGFPTPPPPPTEPTEPTTNEPADYDGDGITDLALTHFDTSLGAMVFELRLSNGGNPRTEQRRIDGVSPNVIPVVGDFDGDGKTDLAVVDPMAVVGSGSVPNATVWIVVASRSGLRQEIPFGAAGVLDRPAPADFDGDGITDIATFRASSDLTPGAAEWFILPSGAGGAFRVAFGAAGGSDLPAPFDFDGDGRAEIATFRPVSDLAPGAAQWFILPSSANDLQFRERRGAYPVTFGASGNADQPVVADYNGDGRADIAAFRSVSDLAPGAAQWFILPSAEPFPNFGGGYPLTFGVAGVIAAVGDYDGDKRPDPAVFDLVSGRWTIRRSTDGMIEEIAFGSTGAQVAPVLAPLYFRLRATQNLA